MFVHKETRKSMFNSHRFGDDSFPQITGEALHKECSNIGIALACLFYLPVTRISKSMTVNKNSITNLYVQKPNVPSEKKSKRFHNTHVLEFNI